MVRPRLLAADRVAVAEVLGDTHSGAAKTRRELAGQGIELVAPAQHCSSGKDLFSKDDFVIDLSRPARSYARLARSPRRLLDSGRIEESNCPTYAIGR